MSDTSSFSWNSAISSFTSMPPKFKANNSAGGRPGGGGNNRDARNVANAKQDDRHVKEKEKDAKAKQTGNSVVGTPLPSPPLSPTRSRTASGQLPRDVSAQGSAKVDDDNQTDLLKLDSPRAAVSTAPYATDAPSTSSQDRAGAVMTDLVSGMRSTVSVMAQTLDVLHSTSNHVAALGPAIDAHYQVEGVKSEVAQHMKAQEDRMQQEKERLQEQLKAHIREHLRPLTNQIVADIVKREVAERVRQKLTEKIPTSLGDECREYNLTILQAKARLHNSEARRHNALIRASGLDEPLQPLLRPLDIPAALKVSALGLPTPPATAPSTITAASLKAQVGRGAGRDSLSVNTDMRSTRATVSPRSAVGATTTPGGTVRPSPARDTLVPPTPSPLFPYNLSTLVSLGPDEVKALVREYGLVSEDDDDDVPLATARGGARNGGNARPLSHMTTVSDAGQSWVEAGLDGTREDELNKFMRYIGVSLDIASVSRLCRFSPTVPSIR
ncbi:hypothetical protein C8T65DRAFT_143790 [Cerioporus squamosus]|nr:hypothetical protein C8T65DRAFT_143790 [Cerioporus squamosus]